MGMQNPAVSEPLDKLSEIFPEGKPFHLTGVRTVKAKTKDYGEGEMVVLKVSNHARELGVWGAYLLAQARSVEAADLDRWYTIERRMIAGFGKGRPVKVLVPASPPAPPQEPVF
jgi:hypothetical protein